jgi:site-specific DNA-methyltransferase (adenine-specific)
VNGEIVQGDAIAELQNLPDDSAQLVFADPPYFQVLEETWDQQWADARAYLDWTMQWLAEAMRVLRRDGVLYCCGQLGKREHTFLHLMSEATRRWQFHDLITWDRVVGYNVRRDSFTPATELLLVLRKNEAVKFHKDAVREPYDAATIATYMKDPRYKDREARAKYLEAGKFATNLWRIPSLKGNSKEKCGHPSQKPLALLDRVIRSATDPGDLVVDPFLGSGTTALAAERTGRRWLGIESDPKYCALSTRRLEAEAALL